MTDRPILFPAPMIRALLDGRKAQTRRVIKSGGQLPEFCGGRYDGKNDPECWGWEDFDRGEWITLDQWRGWNFVPYAPGDRLWVREAWRTMDGQDQFSGAQIAAQCLEAGYKRAWSPTQYEADGWRENWIGDFGTKPGRYRHARFMPRWASRLTLIVTGVRVQRLQEISEADAVAEGVRGNAGGAWGCEGLIEDFADLWNSLHGPDAWDANPWVVAMTFTVRRSNIDDMPVRHADKRTDRG